MIVLAYKAEKGLCCQMCKLGACMRGQCPGEGCYCAEHHGHAADMGEAVHLQQARLAEEIADA